MFVTELVRKTKIIIQKTNNIKTMLKVNEKSCRLSLENLKCTMITFQKVYILTKKIMTDKSTNAEKFNSYFISMLSRLAAKIPSK